jgi:uncharacterized membrane-anchored protein YitT (DUF2179 family)
MLSDMPSQEKTSSNTGARIGIFCIGCAITIFCAIVSFISFWLMTLKMNPALTDEEYWAEVYRRFGSNPTLLGVMVVGSAGVVIGIAIIARAIFGGHYQNQHPAQ